MPSTYSFKDVKCALVGPGVAINLGDGSGAAEEGITFTPTREHDTMLIGADGSGMHSLLADRSGTIAVRVLKTSPVNAQLSAALEFQRASASTHGQNTITLVDSSRGDVITCRQVAFSKRPDIVYAAEGGTNEWMFNCIQMDPTLGGL